MGFAINLTGKIFNKLTVTGHAGNSKDGKSRWFYVCECGKTGDIDGYAIKNQHSCGCESYPVIDLSGKQFGKLKVISLSVTDKKSKNKKWNCLCDCGNSCEAITASLNRGKTKSCGCLNKEISKKKKLPNFTAIANEALYRYKNNAKTRNYSWEISDEKAFELFSKDCYWCGDGPKSKGRKRQNRDKTFINGIDRVDNSIGYKEENVVPCCKVCNKIKMDFTIEEFLLNIKKIYEKHLLNEEIQKGNLNAGKI